LEERALEPIHLPADKGWWPHPAYVSRHREKYAAL